MYFGIMSLFFKIMLSSASGAAVSQGPDHKTSASPGCKPQWCCHCKVVVLGNGVQKSIKDLPAHMKVMNGIALRRVVCESRQTKCNSGTIATKEESKVILYQKALQ